MFVVELKELLEPNSHHANGFANDKLFRLAVLWLLLSSVTCALVKLKLKKLKFETSPLKKLVNGYAFPM